MSFVTEMQNEKQYIPPIRILFVGNDIEFNGFIQAYVTQILHAQPKLCTSDID